MAVNGLISPENRDKYDFTVSSNFVFWNINKIGPEFWFKSLF